jgi:hypothetical protein
VRAGVLAIVLAAGCDPGSGSHILHDLPSPDGRFRMVVELAWRPGNDPLVHARLLDAQGASLRTDSLRVRAQASGIRPEDFSVRWASPTRIEVGARRSPLRMSVWQLESGTWMDRRSDEDRTLR